MPAVAATGPDTVEPDGQTARASNVTTRAVPSSPVRSLRVLYLVVGALIGVLYPFVSAILEARGFSAFEIGVLLAITSAGFIVALPAWGHVGDVVLGRRRALQLSAIATGVTALWFGAPIPALLVGAGMIAYSLAQSGLGMLSDAMAVNALGDRSHEYGRYRLLESASFAVAVLAAGLLFDRLGYGPGFLLAAAVGVLVAVSASRIPDVPRAHLEDYEAPEGDPAGWGPMRALGSIGATLRVEPRLVGVMAAVVLVFLGIITSFTFLPLRLLEVGGSPSVIAASSALSALFEVPAMFVAARFAGRVGLRGLFGVGCARYAIAFVSWVVLADPGLIVASRVLTGLGYGDLTVAAVLTVGALLPDRLQASGQALYAMSGSGVAAIVANFGGGLLFGAFGHGSVFAAAAVASVLAAVVAWAFVPSRGQVRVASH